MILNFFQLEIEVCCEKRLWAHLDQVSEVEASHKLKY